MSKAQIDFTDAEEEVLQKIKRRFSLKNKEQAVKKALEIVVSHIPKEENKTSEVK